jgi:CRP/FNR family cyclic AMP-dependent transcriptional regulator
MNAPLPHDFHYDIDGLRRAMDDPAAKEHVRLRLTREQWDVLAGYLQPQSLAAGQILMAQGTTDRTVYFLESGLLSVHRQDAGKRIHLAMVEAGSVAGEGAFFTYQPRCATVQAGAPCKVWLLTPLRFMELSKRQPEMALEVAMRLGAVASTRLASRQMRAAVT